MTRGNVWNVVILSFALLPAPKISAAEENENDLHGDTVVVAVGVDESSQTSLPPLRYAGAGAEAFAKSMISVGRVAPERIFLLKNATSVAIEATMTDLKLAVRKDPSIRKVIVYFSGYSDAGGLYFKDGTISNDSFYKFLSELAVETKLVIIDNCFVGMSPPKGISTLQNIALPRAVYDETSQAMFIISSATREAGFESREYQENQFTHFLIAGINGRADESRDNIVTINELFHYLHKAAKVQSLLSAGYRNVQNADFESYMGEKGRDKDRMPDKSYGSYRRYQGYRGDAAVSFPNQKPGSAKIASRSRGLPAAISVKADSAAEEKTTLNYEIAGGAHRGFVAEQTSGSYFSALVAASADDLLRKNWSQGLWRLGGLISFHKNQMSREESVTGTAQNYSGFIIAERLVLLNLSRLDLRLMAGIGENFSRHTWSAENSGVLAQNSSWVPALVIGCTGTVDVGMGFRLGALMRREYLFAKNQQEGSRIYGANIFGVAAIYDLYDGW